MTHQNHTSHKFAISDHELIVDNFAGGGGASLGIGMALGRSPDIAINHDPEAIAMHAANHPETKHYCEDVWHVDPVEACAGRPVGLAWFSPDCKHFSKAKGGKPVSKKIRGLAWVVVRWAKAVKPRVIILENVEEFQYWGPVLPNGQPCPLRKGMTFRRWKAQLENIGYKLDLKELRACDYGAPTIRKRLFIVARCDGLPIRWPEPTHGDPKKIKNDLFSVALKPWRTAAECIDWSLSCPSIFERERPLAENTLRRIAAGIRRFVIETPEPFIIKVNHAYDQFRGQRIDEPLQTVTGQNGYGLVTPYVVNMAHGGKLEDIQKPISTIATEKGGCRALISPILVGAGGPARAGEPRSVDRPIGTQTTRNHTHVVAPTLIQVSYGERDGQAPRVPGLDKPIGTLVSGGKHALVAAFLAQYNTTGNGKPNVGHPANEPFSTITSSGSHQSLAAAHLIKLKGTCKDGQPVSEPLATVQAGGLHYGEVRAFLIKYFGTNQDPRLDEPLHTITSKHRFGLVTVHGEQYFIADIGLRMLTPPELYKAQGFPDNYRISFEVNGKLLSKTAQVRMCGNSVSPPNAAAVARAQFEPSYAMTA